jgi:hypothetical protein
MAAQFQLLAVLFLNPERRPRAGDGPSKNPYRIMDSNKLYSTTPTEFPLDLYDYLNASC